MKIYIICPVRNTNPEIQDSILAYVHKLENDGHMVHFPPRDVDQTDPTGIIICRKHHAAMVDADEVHAVWDSTSYGSHFDLGMAYALGKKVVIERLIHPDTEGKSFTKVIQDLAGNQFFYRDANGVLHMHGDANGIPDVTALYYEHANIRQMTIQEIRQVIEAERSE